MNLRCRCYAGVGATALSMRVRSVAARTVGTKTLNHPVVGELVLDWDTLTANTDPDQHLTVWTAEPGSPTHERLRILASWASDQDLPASSPVS